MIVVFIQVYFFFAESCYSSNLFQKMTRVFSFSSCFFFSSHFRAFFPIFSGVVTRSHCWIKFSVAVIIIIFSLNPFQLFIYEISFVLQVNKAHEFKKKLVKHTMTIIVWHAAFILSITFTLHLLFLSHRIECFCSWNDHEPSIDKWITKGKK